MAIQAVTNKDFDREVLQSPLPVVVDFWAEWCGPCKMLAPLLEELAQELNGKAKFVKVNVDEEPGLARAYSIQSIPTLLVFKDGQVKAKHIGMASKTHILSRIQPVLENSR
ncbi:thioredoxin [Candidatus Methylacidithermus pantelleriae]|uniref:Thioredoxin n=1 Tax=Candidatus Methylacidithermus pantelleriae TaxID=2744239 RepID=A0A8J2BJL6_9BACT|nr:thioredoxin [Candidatus Methylacidithermus pantelleriae]CAF0700481.1 thioredoxin 1 [Candidatus Methylacidithermus pantelleriae]